MPRPSRDEAALLKAICRTPADDLPRLVYADWLEEHDRAERAEFIWLQCDSVAAGFPGIPFHRGGDFDPRQPRINELWRPNWARWLRELPRWALGTKTLEFVRGFPERFEIVAAPFFRHGLQLLDRTPVQALGLTQIRNVIPDLIRCVWLREIPEINLFGGMIGDRLATALASAEWLVGTRSLDLSHNALRDAAARTLAECSFLSSVEVLRLRWNQLTEDGVQALAASPYLNPRAVIDLRSNPALVERPEAVRRILGPRGLI